MKQDRFLEEMWQRVDRKEEAILLAQVLETENRKQAAHPSLWELPGRIGWRRLYYGMADVLSISFAITVLICYLGLLAAGQDIGKLYSAVFLCSPALYASIFTISWIKEKQSGRLEIQLSYKYTFFHLITARMLGSSVLGLAVNVVYTIIISLRCEGDVIRLLALSFTSLMLFSLILASGIGKGKRISWGIAAGGVWMAANALAGQMFADWYQGFLKAVPVYVLAAAGLAGLAAYLKGLTYLTTLTFRKEYTDAAN